MNTFKIRMGVPEMEAVWNDLADRHEQGQLSGNEQKFFKKLVKALGYLEVNPRHNSLESHEIDPLTRRYGVKVWQSYLVRQILQLPTGSQIIVLRSNRWQSNDGVIIGWRKTRENIWHI